MNIPELKQNVIDLVSGTVGVKTYPLQSDPDLVPNDGGVKGTEHGRAYGPAYQQGGSFANPWTEDDFEERKYGVTKNLLSSDGLFFIPLKEVTYFKGKDGNGETIEFNYDDSNA